MHAVQNKIPEEASKRTNEFIAAREKAIQYGTTCYNNVLDRFDSLLRASAILLPVGAAGIVWGFKPFVSQVGLPVVGTSALLLIAPLMGLFTLMKQREALLYNIVLEHIARVKGLAIMDRLAAGQGAFHNKSELDSILPTNTWYSLGVPEHLDTDE